MTDEFLELSKEAYDSLSNEEHETLKVLAKDKSIVITKADKGNAVVIQNVEDYRRKIGDLLQTTGKFEKLTGDPTLKREFELQKELRKLNAKKGEKGIERKSRIDDKTYRKILPCGSRAGVMYGLGKVHKSGTPLRPIISAIGTYNYNLAKYLESILKPLVNKEFILTDTYDFVNKISKLDVVIDRYLVSFDVESLFTNVPTLETIELILDLAFPVGAETFHELSRDELKSLLIYCTQKSHFQFNGEYFDQVDGVAMGSPLGPLFANVFMAHFETKHMEDLRKLGIKLWVRYVDDIFATMDNKEQAERILSFLNAQHPNLRFTIEHEQTTSFSF